MNAIVQQTTDQNKTAATVYIQKRATWIEEHVRSAREHMIKTHQYAIEIGQKLVEMKDSLPHGEFMAWRDQAVPFSSDKAEMLMNLAQTPELQQLPQGAEMNYRFSGLYKLARASYRDTEGIHDLTRERALQGFTIDDDEVYILKNAPEPLLDRYLEQPPDSPISKTQIRKLIPRLQKASEPVRDFCIQHHVCDHDVVKTLNDAYLRHNGEWDIIVANEGFMEGPGVHVSEATGRDMRYWKQYQDEQARDEHSANAAAKQHRFMIEVEIKGGELTMINGTSIPEEFSGRTAIAFVHIEDE